jgi:dienelactone hydrolase
MTMHTQGRPGRRPCAGRLAVLPVVCCSALLGMAAAWATGSSSADAGGVAPPAPRGSLYAPPRPLPRRPAGTLIWAQKLPLPLNPPATPWRILYHSRSRTGQDIAVSGFAIVPAIAAPGGARPVYAWAHGSAGQADRCAPSRDVRDNLPPYGGQLVAQGVALVATDYQGLGTPGEPTVNDGIAEGHAILDSVRAIRQLPRAGTLGPVVIAGQSQGGGAALWAAELARSYAPALDLRGVLAFAPAAQFTTIIKAVARSPFRAYLGEVLWTVDGLDAAGYRRQLHLATLLTPAARADLRRVADQCAAQTIADWRGKPYSAVFARDPLSLPSVVKLLQQISPGQRDPRVPILLGQGDRDHEIPVAVSAQLKARYCRLGATVTRRVYPGASHDGVIDAAMNDALAWIGDRFNNRPPTSDC